MSEGGAGGQAVTVHFEDRSLAARMRAGDEVALAIFAERCFGPLYRFAASRLAGDPELTSEIVQTTIAKALANLAGYRGEAALLTWLCACCTNEIRMHFRRRASAPDEVELAEDQAPSAGFYGVPKEDAEADLQRKEVALQVHMALDGLPEHYARALEWKYLERLSVAEIAARIGLEGKAAESLLTRARQAFRASYGRAGAAVQAAEPTDGNEGKVEHGRTRTSV
ncbi:MAG: sigma-70 family RNA polymerase sigma factor [Acidobacteriota bacterium]